MANEIRQAHFEAHYRLAMLAKINCVPSMMIRLGAARYGLNDAQETTHKGGGGEIPVVKIVERDAGFPSEKLPPTKEQQAAAGTEGAA